MEEEKPKPAKKKFRRTKRVLVFLVGFIVLLAILAQIGLWLAVGWLNSEGGQGWLQAQINAALKESGYSVKLDRFRYSLISNITLDHLEISDAQGPFAKAENITIHVSLTTLAAKRLSIGLDIASLDLLRTPEQKQKSEQPPGAPLMEPLNVPDIYFTRIVLADLSIEKLHLSEEVAGQDLILSPALSGDVLLKPDKLISNLTLAIDQPDEATLPLPDKITLKGDLMASAPALSLEKIEVTAKGYHLKGQGTADLGGAPKIEISADYAVPDLSLFALGHPGTLEGTANLSGPIEKIAADIKAKLNMEEAAEKQIGPAEIALMLGNVSAPEGTVDIKSTYQDLPVTLNTGFLLKEGTLALSDIKASAPEATANGDLNIILNGAKATGNLTAQVKSFEPYAPLVQTDIKGSAELKLDLAVQDEKQSITAKIALKDIIYQTLSLSKLNATAHLPDVTNPWPDNGEVNLSGLNAGEAMIEKLTVRIVQKTESEYALNATANGTAKQPFTLTASSDLSGLKTGAPAAQNINALIETGGGKMKLTGKADQTALDLTLTSKDFPLSGLPADLPAQLSGLSMNIDAALKGALDNPEAKADIALSPLKLGDENAPDVTLDIAASYKDKNAAATLSGKGEGIKTLTGNVSLPLTFAVQPYQLDLTDATPLSGKFEANLSGDKMAALVLPPGQSFEGLIRASGTIAGSMGQPAITGTVSVDDGKFIDKQSGVAMNDIIVRADLTRDSLTLSKLTATDGEEGDLKVNGSYAFGQPDAAADFKVRAKSLHLLKSHTADGKFDADLSMSGAGKKYKLSGVIKPEFINVNIPQNFGTAIPQVNIVEADKVDEHDSPLEIALDILFDMPKRLFVRGWGLDTEFGGSLDIRGTAEEPLIEGTMKSIRGTYKEFGKKFDLAKANLRFSGTIPPSPFLDILAETDAEDIKAQVNLTGPVTKPGIKMSSEPALPEDEVLAKVLFGKDMKDISPYQAIQLAQTLRRFAGGGGGGGFDPMGSVMGATGLDELNVEMSEEGGATVGAGKYLTDKVYLEVQGGGEEGSGGARIEIEVTPNISVESEVGQDAQGGAGVFWKKDY